MFVHNIFCLYLEETYRGHATKNKEETMNFHFVP